MGTSLAPSCTNLAQDSLVNHLSKMVDKNVGPMAIVIDKFHRTRPEIFVEGL